MTNKPKKAETSKREPISKKLRFDILNRDEFTCTYCGQKAPAVILHVDHIKPVAKGGTNDLSNLTTACSACNSGKRDSDIMGPFKKTMPTIEEQQEGVEWQQRRIRIINRDGNKCVRCGKESDLSVLWFKEQEGVYLSERSDGEFITTCSNCSKTITDNLHYTNLFIKGFVMSYRFHEVDYLQYVMDFVTSIEVREPEDFMVKNVFNAIDLIEEHDGVCNDLIIEAAGEE